MAQMQVAGRIHPLKGFLTLRQHGQSPLISALRKDSNQTTLGSDLPLSYIAEKSMSDRIITTAHHALGRSKSAIDSMTMSAPTPE